MKEVLSLICPGRPLKWEMWGTLCTTGFLTGCMRKPTASQIPYSSWQGDFSTGPNVSSTATGPIVQQVQLNLCNTKALPVQKRRRSLDAKMRPRLIATLRLQSKHITTKVCVLPLAISASSTVLGIPAHPDNCARIFTGRNACKQSS